MTLLEAILTTALFLSVGFSFLYIKYLIRQIKQRSSDILLIRELLISYSENLKGVYETEMYYGEPILQNLVDHSKFLDEQLREIVSDYDFADYQEQEVPEE